MEAKYYKLEISHFTSEIHLKVCKVYNGKINYRKA